MKDIEKIKSEDLAAQVQYVNPGNFAIEQEVAQLVGATVPQPTEPSADDARELGAQLLVFLRRALTPIRTALRTAVAAIYAHLDSRCTDYTPAAYDPFRLPAGPYDPMRPFVPRTLPNLLQALTAFSARKISNGSAPSDGIPDGMSLARLLCDTDAANAVTEIKDDNSGYTQNATYSTVFPNVEKLTLGCSKSTAFRIVIGLNELEELEMPNITDHTNVTSGDSTGGWNGGIVQNCPKLKKFTAPNIKTINATRYNSETSLLFYNNPLLEEVVMPSLQSIAGSSRPDAYAVYIFKGSPNIKRLVYGKLTKFDKYTFCYANNTTLEGLTDFEIGQGTAINLDLSLWNPTDKGTTFLQNFREHIALRLTANGSGKTLTLSQAVFDTIWNQDGTPKSTDPDSVIYQINKIIKTDKHWSVNRA